MTTFLDEDAGFFTSEAAGSPPKTGPNNSKNSPAKGKGAAKPPVKGKNGKPLPPWMNKGQKGKSMKGC